MAEYIEREAVINKRRRMSEYDEAGWCVSCQAVSVEDIENTPTADVVEVVHGEWIEKHWYKRGDCYYTKNCSCCNCAVKPKYTYNFCPNCGAKMDKKE